jgi:hypothetical protein
MQPTTTKYILGIVLLLFICKAEAQDYTHSIKLRNLSGLGVSYKKLTGFEKGYELIATNIPNGYNLTALRVFQQAAVPKKSDKWFFCYGYGTHFSAYNSYSITNPFKPFDPPRNYQHAFVSAGFDGYAGLEYRFLKYPFTLNIDYNPNFEFFGPDYFRVNHYLSFGVAVVFK